MKNYSAKSSAVRAAKKEFGGEWETKAAILPATNEQGGGWVIIPRAPVEEKTNFTLAEALAESGESLDDLKDAAPVLDGKAERKAATRANREMMGFKLSSYEGKEGPTKGVWRIASEMAAKDANVSRKDVIAECIRQGIGAGTARTQYQAWFSASKASRAA